MKSKTSFFNKTIFLKNVTLYWPIWVVYTVFMLLYQPIGLWLSLYTNSSFDRYYDKADRFSHMITLIYNEGHIMAIAMFALATGMAMYHYLYNSRSANMIHSLPVDRTQLYATNIISGISFLVVPQTIAAALMSLVATFYNIPDIHYIWLSLLVFWGTDIVAFGIVTFCAMITGHLVALPVYVAILNFLPYWVYYIIYTVVEAFAYGVQSFGGEFNGYIHYLSPLVAFYDNVGFSQKYDKSNVLIGAEFDGMGILFIYLLVALVLFAAGYHFYKKRQIELAGDIITVGWVRPVFRYGVGFSAAFFGALVVDAVLSSIGLPPGLFGFIIWMIILGAVGYFTADMLIYKTFHVFKKKNWMGCGIFYVFVALTFFGLYGYTGVLETYIPEEKEVVYATIDKSYTMRFEGDEISQVIAIHQDILDIQEICEGSSGISNDYDWLQIAYHMKDGSVVRRGYDIPYDASETLAILERIGNIERNPHNYLKSHICPEYEEVNSFNGGWIELPEKDEEGYWGYNSISLSAMEVKEFYKAVLDDAKAGHLMKYNVGVYSAYDESLSMKYESGGGYISIDYRNPNLKYTDEGVVYEDEYSYNYDYYVDNNNVWSHAYFSFGPDCTHIIQKLIDFGYIESADAIE